jgi:hypothetical protein
MYPALKIVPADAENFIESWQRLYSGYDEKFYADNIGKELDSARINAWFVWKNGTPLSRIKSASIERYLSPEERISEDADLEQVRQFLGRPGGAIWRIFWTHLQWPKRFPIYDMHVHRAMAFLVGSEPKEIPTQNPRKVCCYLQQYLPFVERFKMCKPRNVDRALWTFGRFLAAEEMRDLLAGST